MPENSLVPAASTNLAQPTNDLELDVLQCRGDCTALDSDIGECQPDPERARACRLAAFLECLGNIGVLDAAAERAGLRLGQVEAWLRRGDDPQEPSPLYARFALAALRARATSEEALLIAAKAQALADGRLGLAYLRTTHPERYADRAGRLPGAVVQQNVFFDPEARARALRKFAEREGLIGPEIIEGEFEAEDA